jgi:hypothetical protein
MKYFFLAIVAFVLAGMPEHAHAQNPTCPTRSFGDATNACASTAFVQQAISPIVPSPYIFNVTSAPYSAACDGVTNDHNAILSAINAAQAVNGIVQFPAANCLSSTSITFTGVNVKFQGISKGASTVTFTTGGFINTSNFLQVEIRDLTFASSASSTCITLGNSSNGPTESIIERTAYQGCGIGINIFNGGATHITHNWFFQCAIACVQIQAPANVDAGDSWFDHNWMLNLSGLAGTGIGVYQLSGGGWKIENNKINQFQEDIYIQAQFASAVSSAYQIHDNSLEGCTTACILMQNLSTTGSLFNTIISGNEIGGGTGSIGIEVQANPTPAIWVTNLGIFSNIIRGVNAINGINVNGVVTLNITGNNVDDGGTCTTGITTGTQVSTGFVTSNTITNCTTKTSSSSTAVTYANNGP